MSRPRCEKAVREYLAGQGEEHLTQSVIKALEAKGKASEMWAPELLSLQRDNMHLLFLERVKERWADDVDRDMKDSLSDLVNMESVLTRVADDQRAKYTPQSMTQEDREHVYADTERMARGALIGIAQGVDGLGTQLMDMVAAQTSVVNKFDFQVRAAVMRLESMKHLCGAAGMKKMRTPKQDTQEEWTFEQTSARLIPVDVPLPCFAKFDDVGEPLTLLKGTDQAKPFLSQFRKREDLSAKKMFERGVVYCGAQPASQDPVAAQAAASTGMEFDLEMDVEGAPPPPARPADDEVGREQEEDAPPVPDRPVSPTASPGQAASAAAIAPAKPARPARPARPPRPGKTAAASGATSAPARAAPAGPLTPGGTLPPPGV